MGVFGSSKKTYYSSTSNILYEEMPSLVKQTVASSIVQNRNIAKDLITNLANGVLFNANRLYSYGATGNYPWGLPNGTVTKIAPQSYDYVQQVIVEEVGSNIEISSVYLDTDPDTGHILYIATYYLLNSKGEVVGDSVDWVYDESTGVYPILDVIREEESRNGSYYPIIPIFRDQQFLAESGQPNKVHIDKACRYLSINPQDLNRAITSDPSFPDNPIEDAYVVIALEIRDKSQVGMEYLYTYFSHLNATETITETEWTYWSKHSEDKPPPMNRIEITDDNYKMELGWMYSTEEIISGVLPKPEGIHLNKGYYDSDIIKRGQALILETGIVYSNDVFVIRKQITDNSYREIKLYGLVHANWAIGKEIRTTLSAAFGDIEGTVPQSFIIPLRQDFMRKMGNVKSHDLMYRSIRLLINDKKVEKLEWYETSFFRFFLTVVAIVISIWYPPAGVAAFSAAAAGIAIINVIVMQILLPIVYKALEDLVGEELAILVAVVAIAYGGNAADLFNAASFGIQKYQAIRLRDIMEDIHNELKVLEDEIDILEEEANERQADVLFTNKLLSNDPYAILETTNYIRRFKLEYKDSTLIRDTTERYTDIARFTDRPESYIRLGHTGN